MFNDQARIESLLGLTLLRQIKRWFQRKLGFPKSNTLTAVAGLIFSAWIVGLVFIFWIASDVPTEKTLPLIAKRLLPFAGWITSAIFACMITTLFVRTKPTMAELRYAGCSTATVFCAFLLLSRRPGFAALATFSMVYGLQRLSELKFQNMRMNLHAYDFIYFLRNRAAIGFLLKNIRSIAIRPLLSLFSCAILLSLIFFIEPAAIDRPAAAVVFLIAVTAFAVNRRYLASPRQWSDYWGYFDRPIHGGHFVDSIFEAFKAWRHGGVLVTEQATAEVPELPATPAPRLDRLPPSIILIVNESTFPPSLYAPSPPDPAIAAFFRSTDGRTHGLCVEAFGGATWKTEFSMLTGIPTSCYGSFAEHVFHWAANKIHQSLPQYLKLFEYRTAMVDPLVKEFIGSDKFYNSIGFDEILDRAIFGTTSDCEPDEFYFDRALDWLRRHFSVSSRPSFLYICTMSNHHPHDVQFVDDGGAVRTSKIADTEFDEYMRRLRRTCRDYANFRAELARRFPDREFVIVHFGDHQPPFTSHLLGRKIVWKGTPEQFLSDEILYRTYFSIDGVNFNPIIDGDVPDTIEVAYLSTVILGAAGLSLDAVHKVRRDLMIRHAGRLFFADDQGRIAAQLNRRMMEAGLISPH